MKKVAIVLTFLILMMSLSAVWEVGEPVEDDYSWTDSNGETHSIHELTESGKAVFIFWGESW